jgi:preprotein translocase subunit YajC
LKEELLNWLNFAFMPANPDSGANPLSMLIPIVGMLAIFYLLLIRPQQKRQKETQKMIDALKKGDRVVTASGLYGTVVGLKDTAVVVKIAENVKVEMLKSAVTGVVEKGAE